MDRAKALQDLMTTNGYRVLLEIQEEKNKELFGLYNSLDLDKEENRKLIADLKMRMDIRKGILDDIMKFSQEIVENEM